MTLATCERLLKHYESTGNKQAADDMRQNMSKWRGNAPSQPKNSKSK